MTPIKKLTMDFMLISPLKPPFRLTCAAQAKPQIQVSPIYIAGLFYPQLLFTSLYWSGLKINGIRNHVGSKCRGYIARLFLNIPHSAIRIPHSIKWGPGQCPISKSLVNAIHRFEQAILFFSLLKKIQLTPFFFQYGDPDSQEPNWFGMGNRFKDI